MDRNKITINEDCGEINILGIIKVNNESTEEEIINIIGGTELKHSIEVNINRLISTKSMLKAFDILFNFKKGKLSYLELILHDKNDTCSWEDWSLEREVNKLSKQNKLLKTILLKTPTIEKCGPYEQHIITTYNYAWGHIKSRYYGQTAYSSIVIHYL